MAASSSAASVDEEQEMDVDGDLPQQKHPILNYFNFDVLREDWKCVMGDECKAKKKSLPVSTLYLLFNLMFNYSFCGKSTHEHGSMTSGLLGTVYGLTTWLSPVVDWPVSVPVLQPLSPRPRPRQSTAAGMHS